MTLKGQYIARPLHETVRQAEVPGHEQPVPQRKLTVTRPASIPLRVTRRRKIR